MKSDIKPFGREDRTFAWVQRRAAFPGAADYLELIAIDELGAVTSTHRTRPFDERATTEQDAVTEVLADGIAQADADLQRREAPEPPPKSAPPLDPATRRFLEGG